MDVLRVVTSGSVDDGKSTLIGRLLHDSGQIHDDILAAVSKSSVQRGLDFTDLSLLTDGLLAEREQGITIDVAYRYFQTPERKYIIADCPGHRQYTRNMVTGASNADSAILLVDASRGLSEQTLRHAAVCGWLQVPHVILAINKLDRVDWSQSVVQDIEKQFLDWCKPMGISQVEVIPMSALDGDMVVHRGERLAWYKGPTLLESLEGVQPNHSARASGTRSSLAVQAINRSNPKTFDGIYRGYAGRVSGVALNVGDTVTVLPGGQSALITELRIGSRSVETAVAGASVTVRLDRELDVSRGDVLVSGGELAVSEQIRAELAWFSGEPLRSQQRYKVKIGAKTVNVDIGEIIGRVGLKTLEQETVSEINTDDLATVDIRLREPVVLAVNECRVPLGRFIMIDPTSGATVGAGMVRHAH